MDIEKSLQQAGKGDAFRDASNDALKAVSLAQELSIKDEESQGRGVRLAAAIVARGKELEGFRKFLTQPLNTQVKSINALFKEKADPIKKAEKIVRDKILAYHSEQEAKAEAERLDRERRQQEATRKSRALGGAAAPAAAPVEEPAKTVKAGLSSSTVKKTWDFEIEDLSKVPIVYLEIKSAAVRTAIRLGTRNIPGLKIQQKSSLAIR